MFMYWFMFATAVAAVVAGFIFRKLGSAQLMVAGLAMCLIVGGRIFSDGDPTPVSVWTGAVLCIVAAVLQIRLVVRRGGPSNANGASQPQ